MVLAKKSRFFIILESIAFFIFLILFIIFSVIGDLSFILLFGICDLILLILMCKWLFSNHELIQIIDNKLIINQTKLIIVPINEIKEVTFKMENRYSGRLLIETLNQGNIVIQNVSDPNKVKENIDTYLKNQS